jgi:hypothetical protein
MYTLRSLVDIHLGLLSLVGIPADGTNIRLQITNSVVDTIHVYLIFCQFWDIIFIGELAGSLVLAYC